MFRWWHPDRMFHYTVYAGMAISLIALQFAFGPEQQGTGNGLMGQLATITLGQLLIQANALFFQVRLFQMRDVLRMRFYPTDQFQRLRREFRNNQIYYFILFLAFVAVEEPLRLSYDLRLEAFNNEVRAMVLAIIYICLIFCYGFFLVQIKNIFQLKKIHY